MSKLTQKAADEANNRLTFAFNWFCSAEGAIALERDTGDIQDTDASFDKAFKELNECRRWLEALSEDV